MKWGKSIANVMSGFLIKIWGHLFSILHFKKEEQQNIKYTPVHGTVQ